MNTRIDVPSWNDKLNNQTRPQKKIYYVRYKWSTNDRAWLDLVPTKVAAYSSRQAAQAMKDANISYITGDVSFMASLSENQAGFIFRIDELD